jgi:hypothetical protein
MIPSRSLQNWGERVFLKYANRRGAKSAKRPLDTLLALLALPHIRDLESRGLNTCANR